MRLEEIQNEIEKDSSINESQLDTESLRIPQLYSKYYNIFMSQMKMMKILDFEYKAKRKARHQYYLGQAPDQVYKQEPMDLKVLRADLDLYLDSDPKLNEIKGKYELQKMKVQMLESFIKTINNRNFLIKNAIEFKRFVNGG